MVESTKAGESHSHAHGDDCGHTVKVNLHIQGRKLRDLDIISKSDPQCIVSELKDN